MSSEEPTTQIAPVESPQMVSTVKLTILKKGEYTLWSMRMEQYLTNTDYSLWQVILNGDGPIQVTTDENGVETKYQLRFHGIKDAKSLLLEVHGAAVSNEDANQKFLRALPYMVVLIKLRLNALTVIEGAILQGNVEHQEIKGTGMEMQGGSYHVVKIRSKQAEKPRIITQNPKVDRRDWNGKMTQKLGLGFGSTKKACFVCGSYNHLIKDCDFHEKRMAKKSVLKNMGKNTGQREIRPVWKSHSPIRRPFHKSTTPNIRISNEKVNTVRVNGVNTAGQTAVSAVKGNGVTTIKASAGNPQQALKNKGIFDSGCSRHMTGNKDFLTDYQDIDGGFVAFGGSARDGKITGKGKIRTDKLDIEDCFIVKNLKFESLYV
ncbi:hypothetical protein Tco_1386579 [Tanacetum coccineum]